ncbi:MULTISPECIES: hypothetical protein [unclassified Microcoleus]|uniref:hypothetical protein n=1 Tax=unclassified Microcoleus TaxID=2642155 RepID=UPI0025E9CA58|nr:MULTISPECIES: hypothetical protein [unclassified Microcoleus]
MLVGCVSRISRAIITNFSSDAPYYLLVWAGRVYEIVGFEIDIFGKPALQDFGLYMSDEAAKFRLRFSPKVTKQLKALPVKVQKQYRKAFQTIASAGPEYRSLRTHRYKHKKGEVWGSAASMALRFYWEYAGEQTISIQEIDSH